MGAKQSNSNRWLVAHRCEDPDALLETGRSMQVRVSKAAGGRLSLTREQRAGGAKAWTSRVAKPPDAKPDVTFLPMGRIARNFWSGAYDES